MDLRVASGMVRYGLPGLVFGVALCWGAGMRGPQAAAQTDGGGGSSRCTGGLYAVSGRRPGLNRHDKARRENQTELSPSSRTQPRAAAGQAQWLYLIDTKNRAFALYRIDPTNPKGIVKLEASRQYEWDLKLEHYNNQAPEPDAIKATVKLFLARPQ